MQVLDRAFFSKEIPLSAARVMSNQNISRCRAQLDRSRDLLRQERISSVCADPQLAAEGRKCLLLRPDIRTDGEKLETGLRRGLMDAGRQDALERCSA